MIAYQIIKSIYRSAVPAKLRTLIWQSRFTRGARERVVRSVEKLATHDEIYSREYYEKVVDPSATFSAPVIVQGLIAHLSPTSVIDVGCGTGNILQSFREAGVDARGLEYSDAGLDICRERGLQVQKFNIETDSAPAGWKASLVISTEVAEHLPPRCADRYVDILASMGDVVFITAAMPDQTGTDHVNEQPNEYWIEKFAGRGFVYDKFTSMKWRDDWKTSGAADFYCHSAMLFTRSLNQGNGKH